MTIAWNRTFFPKNIAFENRIDKFTRKEAHKLSHLVGLNDEKKLHLA